jgi:Tfp pilus assembly protein PilF
MLKQAIAIDPNFACAHYHMSMVFMKRENWTSAIESTNRAISLHPEESEFKAHLENVTKAAKMETLSK